MSGPQQVLLGIGGIGIAAFGGTISALDVASPYNAQASVQLQSDGTITFVGPAPGGTNGIGAAWTLNPFVGVGALVWVRATLSAGTAPTAGTQGTWLQLNTVRVWGNTQAAIGIKTSTLLLEFSADAAGTSPLGSASVVIRCEGS